LEMLDSPATGQVATTITTPPLVIKAGPEPAPAAEEATAEEATAEEYLTPTHTTLVRVAKAGQPAGQLPPSTGVMARFKAVPEPVENLPETPDRDDITRVMSSIRSKVQDCYDTGMVPGQVDLTLTVAGDNGSVKDARVSATSSTATCIRRVARTLRFSRFARDTVTIRYPYSFR